MGVKCTIKVRHRRRRRRGKATPSDGFVGGRPCPAARAFGESGNSALHYCQPLSACQRPCKPGSVRGLSPPGRPFIWDARCRAPQATNPHAWAGSDLPLLPAAPRAYSVLLPVGFAMPPLLPAARCALAAPFRPCRQPLPEGIGPGGGVFSVALSLGSPPAGVTRHRRSLEPGLSSEVSLRGRLDLWHGPHLSIAAAKVKLQG